VPTRFDVTLAACLLVVSQVEVWAVGVAGGGAAAATCLGAIAVLSAWRTRYPLASIAAIWLAAFACAALAGPPASVTFAVAGIAGFYRIGTLPDRRRSYAALAAGLLVSALATEDASLNTYLAIALASFVVPWLACSGSSARGSSSGSGGWRSSRSAPGSRASCTTWSRTTSG
jgi:hypothetical protein